MQNGPDICMSPAVIEENKQGGRLLPSRQKSTMVVMSPSSNLKSKSAMKVFKLNLRGMKKMQSTKNVVPEDDR